MKSGAAIAKAWLDQSGESNWSLHPLKRRYFGGVWLAKSPTGRHLVLKTGGSDFDAAAEVKMLRALAEGGLRTPDVLDATENLLVLQHISPVTFDTDTSFAAGAALAELHQNTTAAAYGFDQTTAFGALQTPNEWSHDWAQFFMQNRLLVFADAARNRGWLSSKTEASLQRITSQCHNHLKPPSSPSLLHGDIWLNNVLSTADGPAFIDPSAFYGDALYEVAFMLTYLPYRAAALKGYTSVTPLDPYFWHDAFPIYQLCFHLAHLALFGTDPFKKAVTNTIFKIENLWKFP